MDIPQYPKFAPVELAHRPAVLDFLREERTEVSEVSFSSIYSWRDSYAPSLSVLDGLLVIRILFPDGSVHCFPPLGEGDKVGAAERLFADGCQAMAGVTNPLMGMLSSKGHPVEPDRDNWDYVYGTADLAALAGTKYHRRRKDINKFEKAGKAESAILRSEDMADCIRLGRVWCEEHIEDEKAIVIAECKALVRAFEDYETLSLFGVVARLNGQICAFAVAEELNPEMVATHFEKADAQVPGAFQYVNREFAKAFQSRYKWVNREQDLGLPGLRENKLSYHPQRMVEKHIVRKVVA
ncbi:MAG: DUF2156 domain-containing protein [Euryarchaeota archaeon]|nr:DUF2156 domain-containing protein [Euryarchaeota archaeon]